MDGKENVWSFFDNSVILGDSRVEAFHAYGFLTKDKAISKRGSTIRNIKEHEGEIIAKSPNNLFLIYGINDMLTGFWNKPKDYADEYLENIKRLQKKLPNTKIYLVLTMPVGKRAYEESQNYKKIPKYNEALIKMCKKNNINYVDGRDIIKDEYYEADGIHFKHSIYSLWASKMVLKTFENK